MSNLTPEEKDNIKRMEINIEQIQQDVKDIKDAIMGNRISGDGGFVRRLIEIENRQEDVEEKQRLINEKDIENNVKVSLISWVFKTIIVIALGVILTELFKK